MAASSKCGETTTMRLRAAGSTSPQVGSAEGGAHARIIRGRRRISPATWWRKTRQQRADDGGADDAGEATRDHGELDAGQRGHRARLHVAQARAALHDGHLDGRHAAAEALGDACSAGWCCAGRRRSRRPSPPRPRRTRATQRVSVSPKSAMAAPQTDDGDDHGPALAAEIGDPPGGHRADEGADARGGVEEARG